MKIKVEDIPVQFHAMVEIIGIDKFIEVAKLYGGTNTYIPTYKGLFRYARNRDIVKQFNGVNHNELAIRYNMCVSNSMKIVFKYNKIMFKHNENSLVKRKSKDKEDVL